MTQSLPEGFQEIWRVEVGSTVHGCNVIDQDDRDQMGVCIEPPEYICGLKGFEQHLFRDAWVRTHTTQGTQPQPPSAPGDLDLVIYSLRKWCRLALSGNPSVLLLLYSPKIIIDTPLGRSLIALRSAFRCKTVCFAFLGYMHEQRERLEGKRGQKNVTRADLIVRYGYDTKYAYHILRLGIQGNEYCDTGDLTVPMASEHRDFLLKVRTGQVKFEEAMAHAQVHEDHLRQKLLSTACTLPDAPNADAVNDFLVRAYREAWTNPGLNAFDARRHMADIVP